MADDVDIRLRVRGGRQAANETRGVSRAFTGLGRSARGASGGMRLFSRATINARGQMNLAAGAIGLGQTALVGLGAIAVKSGLQFNASMEQNQLAFANFLGGSEAARRELGFLQQTAMKTPFELPQITQASRQLLAFGFPVKQANSLLLSLGDAAAGAGLGADAIDQMVRAIGQIRGKGTLQTEELQQLGELGIVNRGKLAKNLGVTTAQLADAGNQGIGANRAIRALQKTLDETFGGQSAKQAQTFNGQLSTLRDNVNQTLGSITRPLFNDLRRNVFPALNATAGEVNKVFNRKDLDLGEKITMSRDVARRRLGPLVKTARDEIGRMDLGNKLGDAFEAAAPRLADAAGQASLRAAGAFAHAWWHAGVWGKLFTTALIAKKLGLFTLIGRTAAIRFGGGWRTGSWGGAGIPTTVPGAPGVPGSSNSRALRGAAAGIPLVSALADMAINPDQAGETPDQVARHQARGRGHWTWDHTGRTRIWVPQGRTDGRARSPRGRGASVTHTTVVKLNERELGRAVDRYNTDETARRRRRPGG